MSDPHHAELPEGEAPRWLDHERNRELVFWVVVVVYVVVLLAGFVPHETHHFFGFEAIPAFQAIYGLVCCIGLALGAAWLRTILMRDEDYYDGP